MIERYSLTSLDDIPEVFGVAAPAGPPRFNIAPLQIAPVCTARGLVAARWGLLPPWRGHGGKRAPHILHAPLGADDPEGSSVRRPASLDPMATEGSAPRLASLDPTGGSAPRPAGEAVGVPSPRLASLDPTGGSAPRPAGGAVGVPSPRLASLDQVPVLRNAFKSQRCLVIADGFYAWWRAGKKSQPMWLHPVADPSRRDARTRTIAFAGVAATHRDDGQPSFALLVGPAGPLVAPYDSTMPFVIPPDGYPAWLTGPRDRAIALLTAAATGPTGWRAEPVSTWVNSVDHDDARCIEPLGNPAQGELF